MLKLLRNFALAGLLLAGAMKLLAWWAVGRDAERLVAALAPYAQVKYDSISAGLDGSVSLDKVTVDASQRVYSADHVVFESPGLFWLLAHALLGGSSLPAQFSVSTDGLKLPPLPWLNPRWFDPATFVPFATAGCGSAFSDADYQRIGAASGTAHERLDYRYDADQHSLNLALNLMAPGFAQLNFEADLKKYDPEAASLSTMWDQVHLDQLSADYTDLDFLTKRNRFCAQRVSSPSPAQFVERHIGAVLELLKQARIEPNSDLVQLYRTLLEHGGQVRVLSLPNSNFMMATAVHGARDDLLRQLNVTARYKDKPPIMFRLAFAPAPEEPAPSAAELAATVAVATPAPVPAPAPTAVPSTPMVATTTPPEQAAAKPAAPAPAAPAAVPEASKAVSATPAPASVPVSTAKPGAHDNLGLHNLDREEAKLAPPSPLVPAPAKREIKSALVPTSPPLLASTAPPPAGSMEALVWKPSVFEALPEAEPEDKTYDVIDYARLGSLVGRYVDLITYGDKKISGFIVGYDDNGVTIRMERLGGTVTFVVAKTRVRQVQLPRQ
jgi:hypothetical protein